MLTMSTSTLEFYRHFMVPNHFFKKNKSKTCPVILGKIPVEKSKSKKGTMPYAATLKTFLVRWGFSPWQHSERECKTLIKKIIKSFSFFFAPSFPPIRNPALAVQRSFLDGLRPQERRIKYESLTSEAEDISTIWKNMQKNSFVGKHTFREPFK